MANTPLTSHDFTLIWSSWLSLGLVHFCWKKKSLKNLLYSTTCFILDPATNYIQLPREFCQYSLYACSSGLLFNNERCLRRKEQLTNLFFLIKMNLFRLFNCVFLRKKQRERHFLFWDILWIDLGQPILGIAFRGWEYPFKVLVHRPASHLLRNSLASWGFQIFR